MNNLKNLTGYLICVLFASSSHLSAQSFSKNYDWRYWDGADSGSSVVGVADGILITIGSFCHSTLDKCVRVIKTDNNGVIKWSYERDGTPQSTWSPIGSKIIKSPDENTNDVLLVDETNEPVYRSFIAKFDTVGTTLAEYHFNNYESDYALMWQKTSEGILSWHQVKINGLYRIVAKNISFDGQILREIVHENGFPSEGAGSIAPLPDNSYAYTNLYNDNGAGQAILGRRNSEGEILWQHVFPPEGFEGVNRVIASFNGQKLYFSTRRYDPLFTQGDGDYLVECYDVAGNFEWRYVFTYGLPKYINNIQLAANGDIIGCGAAVVHDWQGEAGNTVYAATIFRLNSQGVLLWERYFKPANFLVVDSEFRDLAELPDGRLAAVGISFDTLPGGFPNRDAWLVLTDSTGCLMPGCGEQIVVANEEATDGFVRATREVVFRVSPNPATEAVRVEWLRVPGRYAQLALHDATGRLVQQVFSVGNEPPETVQLRDLPSGLYFLTLWENGYVRQTERLIKN